MWNKFAFVIYICVCVNLLKKNYHGKKIHIQEKHLVIFSNIYETLVV